ncbi:MAG TPA: nucleotidyltransferase domain-containing protein [Terriglobales bacterium]|nr:nucleotidyltransferase domain-containing protein [Terriglobales bacterium]
MASENAVPEKQISEFVTKLQQAAGTNLESIILYGSAASGEYDTDYSNINLLAILKDTSFAKLAALAPVVESWTQQRRPAPMLITKDELERSADVFSIELMDMKRQHRVLFGPDAVADLQIPMTLHRAQLEYELREKLILLRQRLLIDASDEKRTWHLLLRSVPAFATLFRHALIAQGQPAPVTKRESVKALANAFAFDASPFENLFDIREHRADPKQFRVQEVAARYLAAVEQVTSAVDKMLDSPGC